MEKTPIIAGVTTRPNLQHRIRGFTAEIGPAPDPFREHFSDSELQHSYSIVDFVGPKKMTRVPFY